MNMLAAYQDAVKKGEIVDDSNQHIVIDRLQYLMTALSQPLPWYKFWEKQDIRGVYISGSVGIGKTYLMDLFYSTLDGVSKTRFHFHSFMQQVDHQLRLMQGQANPLKKIAMKLAKTARVICLDEFLVNDVAYAMILAELLSALFKHNIILVTTANTKPDDLYLGGVGRERFLPAIDLLKTHCDVIELKEQHDYRLGREPLEQAYIYPLSANTEKILLTQFQKIAKNEEKSTEVMIQNRTIAVVRVAENIIWFQFDLICNLPRSQLDYIEIADHFNIVMVSNIPVLTENDTVRVILLIHLVDVFYDRGIRLIISAAVQPRELYQSGVMHSEFARTLSRLEEMQSADYLNRHAPSMQVHSQID